MSEVYIIRVRSRAELNAVPYREQNRAYAIICAGIVVKARAGSGFALGAPA